MLKEKKVKLVRRFEILIQNKTIGRSDVIARKLGISKRSFFRLLDYMRQEIKAPIDFDDKSKRYAYRYEGSIVLTFAESREPNQNTIEQQKNEIVINSQGIF